jgi:DNA-binding MarR family transcriptional regulator
MSLSKHKLQILTILYENLRNPHPQLVATTAVAGQLNIHLTELQQVLKSLDGKGLIQTDPDLQYNLITQEGIHYLNHLRLST